METPVLSRYLLNISAWEVKMVKIYLVFSSFNFFRILGRSFGPFWFFYRLIDRIIMFRT